MPRDTAATRDTGNSGYNVHVANPARPFATLSRSQSARDMGGGGFAQVQQSTGHSIADDWMNDIESSRHELPNPAGHDDPLVDQDTDMLHDPPQDANAIQERLLQQVSGREGNDDPPSSPRRPINDPTIDELEDTSEAVPHVQDVDLDDFQMAMAIWAQKAGISCHHYEALLSALKLASNVQQIHNLPRRLDTLKDNFRRTLPLIPVRRKELNLDVRKIPSRMSKTSWIYSFDLPALVKNVLQASSIRERIYNGMAQLVDHPKELWHSRAWGLSVRTTSGDFAQYQDGSPILPSDFVFYNCNLPGCVCVGATANITEAHVGRVVWVGRDLRSSTGQPGTIVLRLAVMTSHQQAQQNGVLPKSDQPISGTSIELLLHDHEGLLVTQDQVQGQCNDVVLDTLYGTVDYDGTTHSDTTEYPSQKYVVRRCVVYDPDPKVLPYNLLPPLRAELEIEHIGRQKVIEMYRRPGVLSMPIHIFIDAFGLYRNMYRATMGIYMTFSGMSVIDRSRDMNSIPITLGPFAASFFDVIHSLPGLRNLDTGLNISMDDGSEQFVCLPILFYTGDMPQQQSNAACMGPTAKRACRLCMVMMNERGDVEYDTQKYARTRHTVEFLREKVSNKAESSQKMVLNAAGIQEQRSLLKFVSPMLDLLQCTPPDAAHSEYGGIPKLAASLLFTAVLTPGCHVEYTRELSRQPVPVGWGRVQNPLTHLKSYDMQGLTRLTIITPFVLRCWLQDAHLQPDFKVAMEQARIEEELELGNSATDEVVRCYARMARTCTKILSRTRLQTPESVHNAVVDGRKAWQLLLRCAYLAATTATESRSRARRSSTTRGGRAGGRAARGAYAINPLVSGIASQAINPTPSIANSESTADNGDASDVSQLGQDDENISAVDSSTAPSKKAAEYKRQEQRPNMHIALHFRDTVREYASMVNCHVLAGENKHK